MLRSFHASGCMWPRWIVLVMSPQTLGRHSFGVSFKYEHSFWSFKFYGSNADSNGNVESDQRGLHGFRHLLSLAPGSDVAAWTFRDSRWYSKLQSRWRAERFHDVGKQLRTSCPFICALLTTACITFVYSCSGLVSQLKFIKNLISVSSFLSSSHILSFPHIVSLQHIC
jgi:hypothetical protein